MIGANCTVPVDSMAQIAQELRNSTHLPLFLQPNAGQPALWDGQTIYGETPEHFAEVARRLPEEGARILGGCCGTDASFIKALKIALDGTPATSKEVHR